MEGTFVCRTAGSGLVFLRVIVERKSEIKCLDLCLIMAVPK